ncbi:transposase [Escherichia coli O11:H15]|nr:transposase [Escherichia coli O11:H15]EGK4058516.1 transposase [Escherichia coli]EIE4704916.1 transposase [Escherichia coli]
MTALLSNWVDECCQLMTPLNDTLYRYVMNARKLHTDDTPVKVLAPGRKKAKTGYIWTYVRDDRNAGSSEPPAVWFAYSLDRQGETPGATPPPPSGVSCRRMRLQVTIGCSVPNVKAAR